MPVRTWLRDYAPVVLGVGLLATAGLSVAVVGVAMFALGTGTDPLVVLGGTLATLAVLVTVAVIAGVALAWTVLTRLAGALVGGVRGVRARLAERLARLESRARPLSRLGLADRVAPAEYTPLVDPLKRRYVDGDLDDVEFERRLEALLDAGRLDADRMRDGLDGFDGFEDESGPTNATGDRRGTVRSRADGVREADLD
jgi:hypothetical protein